MKQEGSIVTALVPAAGRGLRMGGVRKQYRLLGGKPLLVRTLQSLEAAELIDWMVVAAPRGDAVDLEKRLRDVGLAKLYAVVDGRSTRQASVGAALAAAPASSTVVLVHDGVRPFVTVDRIEAVIAAAKEVGAASLALPVTDTLRRGSGETFGGTVDREGLYRMQTPQAFRFDLFVEARRVAAKAGYEETDDVALVQHLGHPVRIVNGSPLNIKVTTPSDWDVAQVIWSAVEEDPAVGT